MKLTPFVFILLFYVLLTGCGDTAKPRFRYKPLEKVNPYPVEWVRFEKELKQIDSTVTADKLAALCNKYGDFCRLYFVEILNDGRPMPMAEIARGFLSIPESAFLTDSILRVYSTLDKEKKELSQMLGYASYFLGEQEIQLKKIYTYQSLYKFGAFVLDSIAGIGLDFFMGEDHMPYTMIENLRHQYKRRTLSSAYISSALAAAIAQDAVDKRRENAGSTLLDQMIYEGKKMYLKAMFLPETPDSIVYGFTHYQLQYCEKGEVALWEHLGKSNLLYSSKKSDFQKYITEGPFNPSLDLPGNSGTWLGAQIIMQYADRLRMELSGRENKKETDRKIVQRILEEQDPLIFIQKYKPRKS